MPADNTPPPESDVEPVAWQWRHPRATGGEWFHAPDGPRPFADRRTEAEYRPLYAHPPAPQSNVQCCMCGKKDLSIIEGDGGTECELSDGRWVCSAECWDRAVEPPAPSTKITVPTGWTLVPIEPTEDVRKAWNVSAKNDHSYFSRSFYADMLAAVPPVLQEHSEQIGKASENN